MENTPAIIHEDNHIIVVIKPQGMPTQADASGDLDLLTQIKEYRAINEDKPGEAFVGLVHRLDRVTGGVMVFAKTSKAAKRLSLQIQGEQWQKGENAYVQGDDDFRKKYLAVVHGTPKEPIARLEHYLLKDEKQNKVEVVGAAIQGAKKAVLNYRVLRSVDLGIAKIEKVKSKEEEATALTDRILSSFEFQNNTSLKRDTRRGESDDGQQGIEIEKKVETEKISLVEVDLLTGRSHQIRVQLSKIGNPIYGDKKYNAKVASKDIALWAYELSFVHPTTLERMKFVVNPPEIAPWDKFDFGRKGHLSKDV